ncbi:sugar transferase [Patescibacteria group bacterium]|jgi:lipopolysaccharide/colanic/teichoic acid biosynthesis glycosyltransferase|nr:sugar transferase [Patescibacteria group bacterium]MCL5114207.1 sugar transferase [Patescibacteria group bacterium]
MAYRGKRILDLVIALPASLFTVFLTPFVGLAVALEDGFPIFVRLERISDGKVIRVWKFRSMIKGAQTMKKELGSLNERKDGPLFKIKNDPRLTKTGKILRKFRLDEFPQAWNILSGDISLVGPRPHEPGEIGQYPPEFKRLSLAQSGLTGLSQVSGASKLPFKEEVALDVYYVDHESFLMDMKILWKTIAIFFSDPTGV